MLKSSRLRLCVAIPIGTFVLLYLYSSSTAPPQEAMLDVVEERARAARAAADAIADGKKAVETAGRLLEPGDQKDDPQPLKERPIFDGPGAVMNTSLGAIRIQFLPNEAPQTVEVMTKLIEEGYYDGCVFYRAEKNFGVQAGGQLVSGLHRVSQHGTIANESGFTNKNVRGAVNMARYEDPDSATTEFFINVVDSPHLDRNGDKPGYTVWAMVADAASLEVADQMSLLPVTNKGGLNFLDEPVVIFSFRLMKGTGG